MAALAAEVRAGRDVIVAQPTCAYVVKRDYPIYAKGPEADLVAAHTFDPAEYLMRRQRDAEDPFTLRDEFPGREDGSVPDTVTYHVPCHLQAQNAGLRSRDLLKAAGVKCSLVQRCSGIDGTWGYRAENYELARKVAEPLGREIEAAGNETVCGDCHLANGSILQETGTQPVHPMRADGAGLRPGRRRGGRVRVGRARRRRPSSGLTLADVLDLRAYERVRDDYRARIIARKRDRRVALGPVMTLVFECFDTVRFQVQEMARAEKIISDEAIQVELDIYNRLLPAPGELSATVFIELTSDEGLREWLPRLVGIERRLGIVDRRRRGGKRPRGRARGGPDPRDGHAGGPLRPLRLHGGPGGGLRRGGGGGPGGDPSRLRGQDRALTGGPAGAPRGSARHNKGPSNRLTRDNSVRKSLQAHRTCAILFVRRIRSCRSGRSTKRASEQGESSIRLLNRY